MTGWSSQVERNQPLGRRSERQRNAQTERMTNMTTNVKELPNGEQPLPHVRNSALTLAGRINQVVADTLSLYLKTKNFHWHVSGPHFRDYHLMLDEQAEQIFATTDELAERVRKVGGTTLRSIGHIAKLQTIADNDEKFVAPLDMLAEL